MLQDLIQLAAKTGLLVRSLNAATVSRLFDELEKYDQQERAETFDYLNRALNETRASLGAEPIYED
ncbi:MAG: hypothetical protein ACRD9S_24545 [Pyrinomonadaceae bacterium]